jgi:hypothetical protein
MVEKLRRSLDAVEPPTCPSCHLDMKWYQSILASPAPLTINHFFSCPNCNRIAETQSTIPQATEIPPEKLSAPWGRFSCAA